MKARIRIHYKNLIETLSDILTYRNIETPEHMRFVQGYTQILTNQYATLYPEKNMTMSDIEMISEAALIHDVGKIMLPDSVLNRSGCVSDAEALMEHTVEGGKIAKKMFAFLGDDYCQTCYNICLYHHEKYDGSGYPHGLKQDEIPIEAQIVALADMYDILLHTEMHKGVITKEIAYHMLIDGNFGELSPVMKVCLEGAKETMEHFL